ncbi:MAG: hypothetical protein LUH49_14725 [Cloacibacillus porcorum]|uniref:hypothetical protein n=1 Tax=Cloacibacillus porcorum TaxID=1197717 RepID=UPI0023F2C8C6|nr:hypothetical protein [Cloacibacillus porcorum]MCD7878184.1 hypothetical protein [Cloacibacillus porcorum]
MTTPRIIPARAAMKYPGIKSPIELRKHSKSCGDEPVTVGHILENPGKSTGSSQPQRSVATSYMQNDANRIMIVPP